MFCTRETAVVPASTTGVVFIAVAVVIDLLWLLLEIWKLDEGENVWVAVVAFIVVDADCVFSPDWKDDGICNTPEDDDFSGVGMVLFTEGELFDAVIGGVTRREELSFNV